MTNVLTYVNCNTVLARFSIHKYQYRPQPRENVERSVTARCRFLADADTLNQYCFCYLYIWAITATWWSCTLACIRSTAVFTLSCSVQLCTVCVVTTLVCLIYCLRSLMPLFGSLLQRTFLVSRSRLLACCMNVSWYVTVFLRATAYMLSAHMLSQFRPSVCLSVCLSVRHTGGSVKNGWS